MPFLWQLGVAAAAIAVFVGLDLRDAQFRAAWSSDRTRLRRNAAFFASNIATMTALGGLSRALDGAVPAVLHWDVRGFGAVFDVVGCLVVAELVNWLSHFIKHKNARLWRLHSPHHVETQYSTALTLHTHGVEVVISGLAMRAVLRACGFSTLALDVFALVYFATNLYKHCSARLSLGVLDAIIVSPAYHRLHHAKGYEGNYGGVLTLFDVVFGTARFPRPNETWELELGCNTPEPFGYVDEMIYVLQK